jgi:hypothetical protein
LRACTKLRAQPAVARAINAPKAQDSRRSWTGRNPHGQCDLWDHSLVKKRDFPALGDLEPPALPRPSPTPGAASGGADGKCKLCHLRRGGQADEQAPPPPNTRTHP